MNLRTVTVGTFESSLYQPECLFPLQTEEIFNKLLVKQSTWEMYYTNHQFQDWETNASEIKGSSFFFS